MTNMAENEALVVVLLEDDVSYGGVAKRLLEKRGHEVFWAEDLTGLSHILKQVTDADMVLLDLKLANTTSLDSVATVRRHYPHARIFMVTAYASIATTVEAMKRGADDYLPKPITIDEILQAYYGEKESEPSVNTKPISPKRLEWEHIQRVLQENNGNISRTAEQLNMHRRTLQRKLQKKPVDE
ncbi:Photosynthetic apparatus regulatory protein RegA [BD1-7 clade bacterium]|uniref:Photosynthetic apparatus regulatory protein RegA n=1 Tax=BD1-7 clade bacterium TaxID=2029982 RepID=A0A5S9MWV6_9GAMM|nr:Photosynthetic apparatus regulatory protein RegA [BD1-7 clade bacterium]CAA0083093.1 Photosynthetic apparatus regulatory protein RegA [BD1-7 clade bacterium]